MSLLSLTSSLSFCLQQSSTGIHTSKLIVSLGLEMGENRGKGFSSPLDGGMQGRFGTIQPVRGIT